MSSSNILFISQVKCEHSKELLTMLGKMESFKVDVGIIDIHDLETIPSFLDRVPMMLLNNETLLHDEELFEWVRNNEKKDENDVEPFMVNEMKGLSDRYSFMNETNLDHGYVFLDRGEELITSNELKSTETEKIMNYDKYIEQRDSDISSLFKKQNPAN